MKLRIQYPPHIRTKDSNQTIMFDAIIAMLPLYAMATYYYGKRALYLAAASVAICVISDVLCVIIARKIPNIRDMSAVVTGLMIPLLMPAAIRWEIVSAAALFAIMVAKHPFGGVGQNVFNPAVAGVAFAMVCWPKSMFAYPVPFQPLPLVLSDTVKLVASPAKTLMLGGVPTTDLLDMLLGNFSGAMGATNILVLLSCLLYLTVRRTVSLPMTVSFLVGAVAVAALFPRADMSAFDSVAYEIMSGMMLIGAIFLINDPVTSPKRSGPKLLYGLTAGIVSMGLRHLGRYEESLLFAILIMNASVWIMDLWGEQLAHILRRKQSEVKQDQEVQEESEENLMGSEG